MRPTDDRRGERMFADVLNAGCQPQQGCGVDAGLWLDRHQSWFAFGECAGFVDDERGDLLEHLERFGVANEHARFGATPSPDHDGHWCREAERARTRNDQHSDGIHERVGKPRLRSKQGPDSKRDYRRDDHHGHEPSGHGVGQLLNGRPRALCLADHAHNLREEGVAADAVGLHDDATGPIDRATSDLRLRRLLHRNGFPGHHRLVDRGGPFQHDAVYGHALTGTDA